MCNYHKPVCVACRLEMRPEKNGIAVLDTAAFGPYQLWDADLWKCPECSMEIILGFGSRPYSAHYEEGFNAVLQRVRASGSIVELKT